ncbi:MAG TPA: GNAT family N-acetyltransferase [Terriglobales bacterium]|nr:GNAT family N-acetyltransferase [Terriglobales bacterium]
MSSQVVTIRVAQPSDAQACGVIAYEAFKDIATRHGFQPDFPSPEVATGLLSMFFAHPNFYCLVAEMQGKILGSNCLDERTIIGGVGPITVDPKTQNKGVGRMLMDAVRLRAIDAKMAGVRLVQAAYHNRSLSLYTKLGYDAREPLAIMNGELKPQAIAGYRVRAVLAGDVAACNELCIGIHGHERGGDLRDGVTSGKAFLVERSGRLTGYTSGFGFFGHAVAETNEDLQALIASAAAITGPGILVPTRNADLFRWCLNHGLRVIFPGTLMSTGLYHEPKGAWLPSILY